MHGPAPALGLYGSSFCYFDQPPFPDVALCNDFLMRHALFYRNRIGPLNPAAVHFRPEAHNGQAAWARVARVLFCVTVPIGNRQPYRIS